MHAYCKSLRILIVLNFLLLVRPGVELEIVLARPDLELVPGVRAMDLSAPVLLYILFIHNLSDAQAISGLYCSQTGKYTKPKLH